VNTEVFANFVRDLREDFRRQEDLANQINVSPDYVIKTQLERLVRNLDDSKQIHKVISTSLSVLSLFWVLDAAKLRKNHKKVGVNVGTITNVC
jgi:hypothetical protein